MGLRKIFSREAKVDFRGGAKNGEISFSNSKIRRQRFFAKKMSNFQI